MDFVDEEKAYVILDGSKDLKNLTKTSMQAIKKAQVILGGALPKHHINNACLLVILKFLCKF